MATSMRQLKARALAAVQADVAQPRAWSEVLKHYAVDEVVAVSAWEQTPGWNELAEACADRGVIFRWLVVMPQPKIGRYHIDDAGGGSDFVSLEAGSPETLSPAFPPTIGITGAPPGGRVCG